MPVRTPQLGIQLGKPWETRRHEMTVHSGPEMDGLSLSIMYVQPYIHTTTHTYSYYIICFRMPNYHKLTAVKYYIQIEL